MSGDFNNSSYPTADQNIFLFSFIICYVFTYKKALKRRYFALKGKCLYYFATQDDPTPAGIIDLRLVRDLLHGPELVFMNRPIP